MNPPGLAIYTVSKHVTPKDLLPFSPSLTQQATDVADAYGLRYPVVSVVENKDAVPPGWGWILIGDNIDAPDALAYHTKTIINGQGTVAGACDADKIFGLGGKLARGALSIIAATGHEIAEATADPACNRYAQAPNGDVWCFEVCDPVQGFVYKSRDGSCDLASFVTATFFDLVLAEAFEAGTLGSDALGSLDHTNQLDAPFSLGAGGYADILRRGRVLQIGAETPPHKRGLFSRRARRLDHLRRHEADGDTAATPRRAFSFGDSPITVAEGLSVLRRLVAAVATLDPTDAAKVRAEIDAVLTPSTELPPAAPGI